MRRREWLGSAAAWAGVAWPAASPAQQAGRSYRLGWLTSNPRAGWARTDPYLLAFVERLRELGFVEGRNLAFEVRVIEGMNERLPALAAELGRLNCDVLLSTGNEARLVALKQATRETPIVVLAFDFDPLTTGHVASLARPGGRITGMTHIQSELPAKRVELLKELLPSARKIAVLADSSGTGQLASARAGARRLGIDLHLLEFKRQPFDYESAFAEAVRVKAQALLALGSTNFTPARGRIVELALQSRLPSMFHASTWVEYGGLMSYGASFIDTFRRAAEQVAMILNGRQPAEMPIEQPTRFELLINLKTAKTLGLAIPQSLLLRADRVIE